MESSSYGQLGRSTGEMELSRIDQSGILLASQHFNHTGVSNDSPHQEVPL